MSLALAFTNLFSNSLGERQRQRYVSEPVNSHDEEQPPAAAIIETTLTSATAPPSSTDTALSRENSNSTAVSNTINNNMNTDNSNRSTSSPATIAAAVAANTTAVNMEEVTHVMHSHGDVVGEEEEDADPFLAVAAALRRRSSTAITMEDDDMDDDDDDDDGLLEEGNETTRAASDSTDYYSSANNMTLAELQEERELARRRSSACSLLAIFILFRLWISCLQQGDVTLLLLCLLGTSWTVRWIRYNREREEELDERLEQYLAAQQQQQQNAAGETNGTTTRASRRSGNGGIIVDRNELRLLSFQAQLSLAIMESQRHMMETGGYGRSDDHPTTPGVSERAKKYWKRFAYQSPPPSSPVNETELDPKAKQTTTAAHDGENGSKLYGSIASLSNHHHPTVHKDKLSLLAEQDQDQDDDSELPHCSICLGDYETGEALVQLPCGHLYHDSCIASWTASHTKCPLCNFDLESVVVNEDDDADAAAAANSKRQQQQHRNNSNNSAGISIV